MKEVKRGEGEEDIAEVIRRKLEKHKGKETRSYEQASVYHPQAFPRPDTISEIIASDSSKQIASKKHKPARLVQPAAPIKAPVKEESKKRKAPLVFLVVVIFIILLAILAFFIFLAYKPGSSEAERILYSEAGLEKASVKNEEIAYVRIDNNTDFSRVSNLTIIFSTKDGLKFNYVPESLSFQYEIFASQLGIDNFKDIVSVRVSLEYVESPSQVNESGTVTNKTINQTNQSTSTGGGGSGGGGNPPITCTPEPITITCGNFCATRKNNCGVDVACNCVDGSYCYTGEGTRNICINNSINCSDSDGRNYFVKGNVTLGTFLFEDYCDTNLTEFYCYYNGTNFEARNESYSCGYGCTGGFCLLPACTHNDNCTSLNDVCAYGVCNSSFKCEVKYNSSTVCRSNVSDCDSEEFCSGSSSVCPVDLNKSNGAVCTGGKCLVGKCVLCISDGECNADGCYGNEGRDYYCNLTNGCSYNLITREENLTNGNCNDGTDNDCDFTVDRDDAECAGIPTDYISYWKFEDNANDEAGRNNGTVIGSPVYVDGVSGKGIKFDGVDDYISVTRNSGLEPQNLSVGVWIKAETLKEDSDIVNRLEQTNYASYVLTGNSSRYFGFNIEVGNYIVVKSPVGLITDNSWHYLFGTYDHQKVRFYIDGIEIGNGTYNNSDIYYRQVSDLSFGRGRTADNNFFNGTVDEVMIFDRALSSQEVLDLYNLQKPLVAPSLSPFILFWEWVRRLLISIVS